MAAAEQGEVVSHVQAKAILAALLEAIAKLEKKVEEG